VGVDQDTINTSESHMCIYIYVHARTQHTHTCIHTHASSMHVHMKQVFTHTHTHTHPRKPAGPVQLTWRRPARTTRMILQHLRTILVQLANDCPPAQGLRQPCKPGLKCNRRERGRAGGYGSRQS
jgi:hypothetical protein